MTDDGSPIVPRVVLVTGAGRGIGAATAHLAARRGWDVAVNHARDAARAERVADAVRAEGRRAITVRADVSDERAVVSLFERVDAGLGPLTALVNNAGIVDLRARLEEMTGQRLRRMLEVNTLGVMLCAREAVRRMSTRHGGRGGSIVNVSSGAARMGAPHMYVDYAASKGAVDTFTVGLAKEVVAEGIRVNGVRPGIVDTEIHADSGDARRVAAVGPTLPMGRAGRPEEVATAILWLMSEEAGYVAGSILDVAGGR
jgi:NAD(P)-dependent dehydrogenase (short-subunit alcohol dehydrogenase family)